MQYKDIDQYVSPFDLVVNISIKVEHNILKPQEEETLEALDKGDTLVLLTTGYWKSLICEDLPHYIEELLNEARAGLVMFIIKMELYKGEARHINTAFHALPATEHPDIRSNNASQNS